VIAATVEAAVPEVGIAWDVGAAVEAADGDEDEFCAGCVVCTGRITVSLSTVGITCVSCCEFRGLVAVSDLLAAFVLPVHDSSVSFQEVVFYFSGAYTI